MWMSINSKICYTLAFLVHIIGALHWTRIKDIDGNYKTHVAEMGTHACFFWDPSLLSLYSWVVVWKSMNHHGVLIGSSQFKLQDIIINAFLIG